MNRPMDRRDSGHVVDVVGGGTQGISIKTYVPRLADGGITEIARQKRAKLDSGLARMVQISFHVDGLLCRPYASAKHRQASSGAQAVQSWSSPRRSLNAKRPCARSSEELHMHLA